MSLTDSRLQRAEMKGEKAASIWRGEVEAEDERTFSPAVTKIYVLSIKSDFMWERRRLWEETLPELQLTFLSHGLEIHLIDCQQGLAEDITYDIHMMEAIVADIKTCCQNKVKTFVLILLGDKLGHFVLPQFIEAGEFLTLKNDAAHSGKDVKLLEAWYKQDEFHSPPGFCLQPVNSILTKDNHSSANSSGVDPGEESWITMHGRLLEILQSSANTCFQEGRIRNKDRYFTYGIEWLIEEVVKICPDTCLMIQRDYLSDTKNKRSSRRNLLKRSKVKGEEQQIQERLLELTEALSAKISDKAILKYQLHSRDDVLDPFNNADYSDYLDSLHNDVMRYLSEGIRQSLDDGFQDSEKETHLLSEVASHFYRCRKYMRQYPEFIEPVLQRIKDKLPHDKHKCHKMLLLYGPEGCGKTTALSRVCLDLKSSSSQDCVLLIRYVGLTQHSGTSHAVLSSICSQIDKVLGREFISPLDHMDLILYYKELLKRIDDDPRRLWIVALDDLDLLISRSESVGSQADDLSWLGIELPANVIGIATITVSARSEKYSLLDKLIPSSKYIRIPNLKDKQLEWFVDPDFDKNQKISGSSRSTNLVNIMKTSPQPLFCVLLVENTRQRSPDVTLCADVLGGDPESAIVSRLEMLEERYGAPIVSGVLKYLCASSTGITEMELLDVMSCDNELISRIIEVSSSDQIRFPHVFWLRLKSEIGYLLEVNFLDQKLVIRFSHRLIRKVLLDKYRISTTDMMKVHNELADLYLETWIAGRPLMINDSNLQIMDNLGRFIGQQPLVFGDTKYNMRKINQLWRHLLYAGKTNLLKDECFCRFEYLLAYLHGTNLPCLLNALDLTNARVLDNDIQIIRSVLTQSMQTLSQDPLQLANELIGQLQQIKDQYKTSLDSLVQQAMEWCDSFHMPIVVPLSSWLPDPRVPLITKATFQRKISKLCISSTGQYVFCSAGSDVYMCHVASNKQIKILSGHTGDVTCLQCAQDGEYLFTGSTDGSVHVWQISTGRIKHLIRDHSDTVMAMTVSHRGNTLVTGSKDKSVKVIQIHTGQVEQTVSRHSGAVSCVRLNYNNTLLATGSHDKTINMWDFEDMVLLYTIQCTAAVTHLTLSVDNTFLLYACKDDSIQVASQITGTVFHELIDNKIQIGNIALSKDCVHCAVGGLDGHLYIYNLRSKELLDTFTAGGPLCDVTITDDDHFIFTACKDRVLVWTFFKRTTNRIADTDNSHTKAITCYCMSVEGKMAITGSDDCLVKLWNLDISDFIGNLEGHTKPVTSVSVAAQEAFAVSGAEDNTVKVWSIMMGCVITDYKEHNSAVVSIYVLSDNRRVLTADRHQVLYLWHAEDGVTFLTLHGPTYLFDLSLSREVAVSGDKDESSVRLWRVDDGTVIQVISHTDYITCVAFSADCHFIVTGSADMSLKVWEAKTGKLTQVLVEHDALVSCAAITRDNSNVVSGSHDKCLLVWNLMTGEVEHRLTGHRDHVTCVKITDDNSIAISGSADGTILVWCLRQGTEITMFDMHAPVVSIAINANADKMVVMVENGTSLPLLCLHNSPAGDAKCQHNTTVQQSEDVNLLPIRPRMPTFHRQITTYTYPKKKCHYETLHSETPEHRTSPQKAPLQTAQKAKAKQRREKHLQKDQREQKLNREEASKSSICLLL